MQNGKRFVKRRVTRRVDFALHIACNRSMSALNKAIAAAGGAAKLAAALHVSIQRLSNWVERGVPAERCPEIEQYTREIGSVVTCEELRPDVNWGVLRGTAVPAEKVA